LTGGDRDSALGLDRTYMSLGYATQCAMVCDIDSSGAWANVVSLPTVRKIRLWWMTVAQSIVTLPTVFSHHAGHATHLLPNVHHPCLRSRLSGLPLPPTTTTTQHSIASCRTA